MYRKTYFHSSYFSSQEVPLSTRQLFAVEFPGIVLNQDRAIRMLGGLQRLAESFTASLTPSSVQQQQQQRLQLQFNPDDVLPRMAVGEPVAARSAIVLRVVRQRHKVTGKERLTVECLGHTSSTYEFNGLADLQYLTFLRTGPNLEQFRDLYDDLVPSRPLDQVEEWFCRSDVPFHCITTPLARQDAQSDYRLWEPTRAADTSSEDPTTAAASSTITSAERSNETSGDAADANMSLFTRKSRSGMTVSVSVAELRTAGAPTGPTPEMRAQLERIRDVRMQKVLQMLDDMLAETPVVSLAYALHKMRGTSRAQTRLFIRAKAYHMSKGPWHHLWLKFGYNPIVNPGAAIYQSLDLRVRQIRQHGRSSSAGLEFALESHRLPQVGQLLLQLCHIRVPSIVDKIASVSPQPQCHDIHGWYSEDGLNEFRQLTRDHVRRLLPRAVLGVSAAAAAAAAAGETTAAATQPAGSGANVAAAKCTTSSRASIGGGGDDNDDEVIEDNNDNEEDDDSDADMIDEEDDEEDGEAEVQPETSHPSLELPASMLLPPQVLDDAEDLLLTLTSS